MESQRWPLSDFPPDFPEQGDASRFGRAEPPARGMVFDEIIPKIRHLVIKVATGWATLVSPLEATPTKPGTAYPPLVRGRCNPVSTCSAVQKLPRRDGGQCRQTQLLRKQSGFGSFEVVPEPTSALAGSLPAADAPGRERGETKVIQRYHPTHSIIRNTYHVITHNIWFQRTARISDEDLYQRIILLS